jgi:hypothetical protein
MTLTILYRHRDRPGEAGMTMISAQEEVAAQVNQLERRGFIIDKITTRLLPPPSPRTQAPTPAGQASKLLLARLPRRVRS